MSAVREAVRLITQNPSAWQTSEHGRDVRRLVMERFPFIIVYAELAEADLVLLAEVLGHSDTQVTNLYKHMLPGHLARARNGNVVNFAITMGPATVEAHRRWRQLNRTVPATVPTEASNVVTIERDTGFEPATFSLGS